MVTAYLIALPESLLVFFPVEFLKQLLEVLPVAEEVEIGVLAQVGDARETVGNGLGQPGHRTVGVLTGQAGGVGSLRLGLHRGSDYPKPGCDTQAAGIGTVELLP